MNSKFGKTSDSHRLLSLTGKINLKRIDKYVVFPNLIIYYIWKILKSNKCQRQCRVINLNHLMDHILY